MNVTVKTYIGTIFLENIDSFNINECELSIIFKEDHEYVAIEEIDCLLNMVGISVGAYHFNHIDCYGNYSRYGTDVLCILPEHLRDNIHIQITK